MHRDHRTSQHMDAAPNPGRLPVLTMARGLCARKRSRSGSGWANAGSRVANGAEWSGTPSERSSRASKTRLASICTNSISLPFYTVRGWPFSHAGRRALAPGAADEDAGLEASAVSADASRSRFARRESVVPSQIPTGDVHHLRLTVTDVARSRQFYTRLLGFEVAVDSPPQDDPSAAEVFKILFGGVVMIRGNLLMGLRPM